MKATEIQELTNKFISLRDEAEFKGCADPFQSFWQGFDIAVELALKAMQGMVENHAEDIECDFESKEKRYISCGGYELKIECCRNIRSGGRKDDDFCSMAERRSNE